MYYSSIFILLFLLTLFQSFNRWSKQSDKLIYAFLFVILGFTAGLKYETGIDWLTYTENFERLNPINVFFTNGFKFGESMSVELSFGLISSCIKFFGGSIQAVFFVMAFISMFFLFKSLQIYSSNKSFSLLIYFCFIYLMLDMSGIRQGVALNIFFYSIQFIRDKKLTKYIICIFFASTFHYSALVLLPLYFFINAKISNTVMYVTVAVGFILFIFKVPFLGTIAEALVNLFGKSGAIGLRLYVYTTSGLLTASRPISVEMFIYLSFFIVASFYKNRFIQGNELFNIFWNIIWLHLLACFFLWEYYDLSVRLAILFVVGYVALLPHLLSCFLLKTNRLIIVLSICIMCFFPKRAIFFELSDGSPYNPYQNYWYHSLFNKKSTGHERLEKYNPQRQ